uniref:Uncharacterized protein n=1 Tax=Rhizophora mucronata TaxID=61149 RepID=A0A2P2Q036_RHIMU
MLRHPSLLSFSL